MRAAGFLVILASSALVTLPACSKKSGSSSASDGGSSSSSASTASTPGVPAPLTPGFEGDVTMHWTPATGAATDLVFHIKGPRARVDVPTKDETAHVIFDNPSNRTYVVLDSKKEYLETDHLLQRNFPGPRPLPATMNATGQHESIAGTDCEDWTIAEALGKRATVCVAKGVAFFDFNPMRPVGGVPTRGWQDELRLKGLFPLKAIETDQNGKETQRMEVTSIMKKPIDDSLFVPPAGYKSTPTVRLGDFPRIQNDPRIK